LLYNGYTILKDTDTIIAAIPNYKYYRRDHLGNNREVWVANTKKTIQRTQYYPSGLPWATNPGDSAGLQQRKYNGKEFVEMHGYDTYDIVWRQYYPAIMRFQTVDPLAENDPSVSPYVYCRDNPINRIDPDGMKDIPLPEVVVVAPKPKNTVIETHAITIPLSLPMVYSMSFTERILPVFFISNTIGSDTNRYDASSKNSPHANQKAKEAAEQEYNEVEQEYDNLKSKPNKTPDDKNKLEKLKRSLKLLKDKMDFKGENHSRNAKGNR
jgi:RHS repeat-associated protein